MLIVLFFIICVVLTLFYLNGKYNEIYWKKRGVTIYKKNKVLGIFWDFITKTRPFFEYWHDIYKEYPNKPAVGIGSLLTPALFVGDLNNIQFVLKNNFHCFSHRGFDMHEDDILANNILFLNGDKWKLVRHSMTPLFTSAKLKKMYYIVDKSAVDFVYYLKENPPLYKTNTFDTISTFCSAAIGAAVFGVTTKSIFDSPFLVVAQNAFRPRFSANILFLLSNFSSSLVKLFKIKHFKHYEQFFIGAIKQVVRQRERENVKKHDFADICVALQKVGTLKDSETGIELEPTDELLAAQGFFFFIAGVEPISTAIFSTLVEIGKHPEIQKRLHDEIDLAFQENNGKILSDVVNNIVYLNMVICEAMRIHPPIGFLSRKCVKDTVLPTGNIKIDKGTNIFTSIYGLHHNPEYFPDPEIFNPDRFSQDNIHKIQDSIYIPFGAGNRMCVGIRYAELQTKSGLIHLLRNFSVKTVTNDGGIKYRKDLFQLRLTNVDVEFTPRVY